MVDGSAPQQDMTGAHDAREVLRAVARTHAGQRMLVLVGGPPASGKTGVAEVLAELARLTSLHKDAFKEPLMTELGVRTVDDSVTLGRAAVVALYAAADAVLSSGVDVLLESTFNSDDIERIAALRRAHACAPLQIHVTATVDVLARRWEERAPMRHPGHLDLVRLPEMRERVQAGTWAPLPLDAPLLVIDTTADTGESHFDAAAWLEGLRRSLPEATRR